MDSVGILTHRRHFFLHECLTSQREEILRYSISSNHAPSFALKRIQVVAGQQQNDVGLLSRARTSITKMPTSHYNPIATRHHSRLKYSFFIDSKAGTSRNERDLLI